MTASSDIEHGGTERAAGVPPSNIEQSPLLRNETSVTSEQTTLADSSSNNIGARSIDSGITRTCLASALIMVIAPLQYGYHIAELNTPKGIITKCSSTHDSRLPLCLPMNDNMYSLATSIFAVGGLFGSLAAGWMAERWGRRGALMYNNLPFVVGPLLMAFALTPSMLVAGRLISGIGSGASIVIAPLYLSEIAPVKLRGTLNLLNQLSIVVGILITLIIGVLANSGPYWRVSVGFGLVLASLQLTIIQFAVESPRYLWSRGKRVEARQVLRSLRGTANVDDEVGGWASSDSDASGGDEIPSRADRAVTIFNIFMFPEYRKPWALVLLLQFGQQLSGINTVFYYSSSVLEKMFSSHVSGILTMLIGVLNVLATSSGALIVDRFGRRPLLFASMAAMTISITLLGLSLAFGWNVMAVASLYLVVASFAPGYGPVPFLLGTEFFDVKASGAGGSWALAANWMGTFIVAAAFLPVQNIIGQWVFGVFVAALVICGAVFYVHVPETKGKTIEDIVKEFK
ncbi:Bifunctional purine biosynthesis protein PurH [Linderina macrospora]|uniref:Bifunctional purine biosynthesis protein PurH n=1 Tax=Linderina macrospora TaxID=4868 RepID=A0ACC1JEZ6_9FUNG|nr:Bifunctional purine biosynthesis protein PurH [Linderina macrospora]